jgi:hypothetical protein
MIFSCLANRFINCQVQVNEASKLLKFKCQEVARAIGHYRLNFDLNYKSRQKFHNSLKEHHKISNIPKFAVFQSFCITNGKLTAPKGIGLSMDNLHVRLNFNLSKVKGIKHNS